MDVQFLNSVTELLKIPQLSAFHRDIRTVWNNYCELTVALGLKNEEGLITVAGRITKYDDYMERICSLFDTDVGSEDYYHRKVEECLRKDTSFPEITNN